MVCGVARSGTTMIAQLLIALGIPMGVPKRAIVYEDQEIATLMENSDKKALKNLISARNRESPIWGFKRPKAFRYIHQYFRYFRNLQIIIPFRDPIAIANRNVIAIGSDPLAAVKAAASDNMAITAFLSDLPKTIPCLMMSYEKSLNYPEAATRQVSDFCGLALNTQKLAQASDAIQLNNPNYWRKARQRTTSKPSK